MACPRVANVMSVFFPFLPSLLVTVVLLCAQAQTQMVVEAMKYLEEIPDREEKVKLITTLRTVTDGKVIANLI